MDSNEFYGLTLKDAVRQATRAHKGIDDYNPIQLQNYAGVRCLDCKTDSFFEQECERLQRRYDRILSKLDDVLREIDRLESSIRSLQRQRSNAVAQIVLSLIQIFGGLVGWLTKAKRAVTTIRKARTASAEDWAVILPIVGGVYSGGLALNEFANSNSEIRQLQSDLEDFRFNLTVLVDGAQDVIKDAKSIGCDWVL